MKKIIPFLVLFFLSTAFVTAQEVKNNFEFKTNEFEDKVAVELKFTTQSAADVFEFVSGRSLDVKSKENHESISKPEINHIGFMIKSRLVKKMYKKISILNQSLC